MKLHVGCGTIYLDGYLNIDVPGPKTFLAQDRPDLVDKWKTTDDKYFARHEDKTKDKLSKGPLSQDYVCDKFGDFSNLPVAAWSVSEVLARHSFEHLSITEAHKALDQVDEVLTDNGILRLDVPDPDATLDLFLATGDPFYKRHLLGPRLNDHGFHISYTRERLRALVEEHGFIFVEEEPNIHFYPAFCLKFVKPGLRQAVEYVTPPYPIPDSWNVAEVGPGRSPLMRANLFMDRTIDHLKPLQDQGKSTVIGDLMDGFPRIENKQFDYVWCSHVLEHVQDPIRAAATLSRIAKRGTVVMPSALKESLFNFEESDHKWLVLPSPVDGGSPVFVRGNVDYMNRVKDVNVQKITSQLFRTGPNRIDERQRHLRRWFYQNEVSLDVVHHWSGELKLTVIG